MAEGAETKIFEVLAEAEATGSLTTEQVEYSKYKANILVTTLQQFGFNERKLADTEKRLKTELERHKESVRRIGDGQFDDTTMAQQLNRDMIKCQTELAACRDREAAEADEIEKLEAQKQHLGDELESYRQTQENVLQPRLQALQKANDEAHELLEKERQLIGKLEKEKLDILSLIDRIYQSKKEVDESAALLARDISKTKNEPADIKRQADQLEQVCFRMRGEMDELDVSLAHYDREEKEAKKRVAAMELDMSTSQTQMEKFRVDIDGKERFGEKLLRDLEDVRTRGAEFHSIRTQLDVDHRKLLIDQHRSEERLASRKREFAREMKILQKKHLEVEESLKSMPELETILAENKKRLVRAQEERQVQKAALDEAKMEMDVAINGLLNQQDLQADIESETSKIRREIEENQRILSHLTHQEYSLHQQMTEVAADRESASHEATASRERMRDATRKARAAEMEILELERRIADMQNTCSDYIEMFERVKAERNKYSEVIARCHLVRREYTDKLKVAEGELEILQQETVEKDKKLQRGKVEYVRARQLKDDIRSEINKALYALHYREEEQKQLEADSQKMELGIRLTEQQLAAVREDFEMAVYARDTVGRQVVNRNEELCLLYQRSNVNEAAIRRGELELRRKEEEERVLQVMIEECKRELNVARRDAETAPAHVKEANELREQLRKERLLAAELAAKLESPSNNDRWTSLGGEDLTTEDMASKFQGLEERMKRLEAQEKQKQTQLEELEKKEKEYLARISQAKEEDTVLRAKAVETRTKVAKVDEKIVASLAEVALMRAHVMQLEQAQKDLSISLSDAQSRESKGQAPTVDAEREWFNMELRRQLKLKEMKEQEEKAGNVTATGQKTMAPKRFNAYIPEDGLGIPKPYGAHAPFRPYDTAAARIFKKP